MKDPNAEPVEQTEEERQRAIAAADARRQAYVPPVATTPWPWWAYVLIALGIVGALVGVGFALK